MENSNKKEKIIIEELISKYYGEMKDCDTSSKLKGPCGDIMEFYLKIGEDKITEIKYRTTGCGWTKACGATVCFYADKRKIEEALFISPGLITKTFGVLPQDHEHCPILAANSFHLAIANYMIGKQKKDR